MSALEAVARPASEKGHTASDNKSLELVPKNKSSKSGSRLGFLDWTRGVAVTIMLQGHVFHSFARQDLRNDGPFIISQFLGGIGPAIFLVLTGVTLAFLMDRRQTQELPPVKRWAAALRRSGYL